MKQTLDFILEMVRYRRFLYITLIAATIISIIIVFIIPVLYTASITIVPPDDSQQSLLGSLTSISKQATGMNIGGLGSMTVDLYSDVLRSELVLDSMIEKHNLMEKWGQKSIIFTRKMLKRNTKLYISTSEMLIISFTDHDPEFAASICNDYVYYLNKSLAQLDSIKMTKQITMMQDMLASQNREIEQLKDRYIKWQKENKSEGLETSSLHKTPALNLLYTKLAEEQLNYYLFEDEYNENSKTMVNQRQLIASIKQTIDSTLALMNQDPGSVAAYRELQYSIEAAVLMKMEIENRIKYSQGELKSVDKKIYTLGESQVPDFKSYPPKKIIVILVILIVFLIDILYIGIKYYTRKNIPQDYRKQFSNDFKKVFNDPFQTRKE